MDTETPDGSNKSKNSVKARSRLSKFWRPVVGFGTIVAIAIFALLPQEPSAQFQASRIAIVMDGGRLTMPSQHTVQDLLKACAKRGVRPPAWQSGLTSGHTLACPLVNQQSRLTSNWEFHFRALDDNADGLPFVLLTGANVDGQEFGANPSAYLLFNFLEAK